MTNTLILCQSGNSAAQRIGDTLGYIIGNTRVQMINEAAPDISQYENLVLIFSCDDSLAKHELKTQLVSLNNSLDGVKVFAVGFGTAENHFNDFIKIFSDILGRVPEFSYFIQDTLASETGPDMRNVIETASIMSAVIKECPGDMEKDVLKTEIETFIRSHNTFALTTAFENEPRCSPVEYLYVGGNFYVITEGGMKFRGILSNRKVSAGIFDAYENMGNVKGLQFAGTAELVPLNSDEYNSILRERKIAPDIIKKLPISLYLVKIKPEKFEFLNAEFKSRGYRSKQIYDEATAR